MTELSTTYDGEAWEFFYDHLSDMVAKGLTVRLNDGAPVTLVRVEGKTPERTHVWDTEAVLVVNNEYPASSDEPVVETRIPLFKGDELANGCGECNITKVHIL